MKMLVVFEKLGAHRFIGHLDLVRAMQRALRRSGLPVCYSQGFNPHLLLSFASPLSVGTEGEREIMELPLCGDISEADFLVKINQALPEGLKARGARLLADEAAPAMARLFCAVYRLVPDENANQLRSALPGFLARERIPYLKKTKSGERMDDLRPMIYNLTFKEGALIAVLAAAESGTAKPDQLAEALCAFAGIDKPRFKVMRTALLDEAFVPLEGH